MNSFEVPLSVSINCLAGPITPPLFHHLSHQRNPANHLPRRHLQLLRGKQPSFVGRGNKFCIVVLCKCLSQYVSACSLVRKLATYYCGVCLRAAAKNAVPFGGLASSRNYRVRQLPFSKHRHVDRHSAGRLKHFCSKRPASACVCIFVCACVHHPQDRSRLLHPLLGLIQNGHRSR